MKILQWLSGLRGLRIGRTEHDERRRVPRLRCYFKVEAEAQSLPTQEAYVVEMNTQGLRFHCSHNYRIGQALHLRYPNPKPISSIPVKVIWSQNRRNANALMGCQFLLPPDQMKESWAGYILHQLGFPVEQDPDTLAARQAIRYPAQLEAMVQTAEATFPLTVLDLGAGGALVETKNPLPEDVVLDILDPPGLSAKLRLVCRCLNSRPSPVEGRVLCHLQWVYLTPQETKKLGVLLIQLLRQGSPRD